MPRKTTRQRTGGPLEEYRRKRDFTRTAEPRGKAKHGDELAEPGTDVTADTETSVATGRTMEEIAAGKRRRR